jgi:hypothetical protein
MIDKIEYLIFFIPFLSCPFTPYKDTTSFLHPQRFLLRIIVKLTKGVIAGSSRPPGDGDETRNMMILSAPAHLATHACCWP